VCRNILSDFRNSADTKSGASSSAGALAHIHPRRIDVQQTSLCAMSCAPHFSLHRLPLDMLPGKRKLC
jgi:hypothetical protein